MNHPPLELATEAPGSRTIYRAIAAVNVRVTAHATSTHSAQKACSVGCTVRQGCSLTWMAVMGVAFLAQQGRARLEEIVHVRTVGLMTD